MKTDVVLKSDVLDELEWEPRVNSTRIGVAVTDGVVTLSGEVASYQEKLEAERAALRVEGVKGAANEIEIHLPGTSHRSDADIARAAVASLTWNSSVPPNSIQVVVRKRSGDEARRTVLDAAPGPHADALVGTLPGRGGVRTDRATCVGRSDRERSKGRRVVVVLDLLAPVCRLASSL